MKRIILLLIFTAVGVIGYAQNTDSHPNNSNNYSIIRTSTGIGGSSSTVLTPNGIYIISQSIGQSSAINTGSNSGFTLRQGYQQPSILSETIPTYNNKLKAKIFPNPFTHSIFISFSEHITKEINVLLFDVKGSLVYSQKYAPSQFLKLNLGDFANGNYILNVEYKNKSFTTKLIKR